MVAVFVYDAPTDKLTMTGSTTQFAEDAYQADLLNGWGQVTKLGDRLYLFECNVVVNGQASDTNVVIQVGTAANPKYFHCDYVPDFFHLGSLTGDGSPIDGCCIINYATPYITMRGDFELYDSRWFHRGTALRFQRAVDIKGSILNVTSIWIDTASSGTIQDTWIHGNGTNPNWIYPEAITIDNCVFENFSQGVRYAVGGTFTLTNVILRNCPISLYFAGSNTTFYAINCGIDWTKIVFHGAVSNCIAYHQYTFNRIILKEDGTAYSGKSWTLKDKDGNTVASGTTQVDGKLSATDIVVSYGYLRETDGGIEQLYSPFDLWVDGETDYLDLNIYKMPIDNTDIEGCETMVDISDIIDHLTDIKGTGFVKDTDSLVDIRPETDKISNVKTETDKIPTLLIESQSHPTLVEIEATTVLAKEATVAKEATTAKDATVAKEVTLATLQLDVTKLVKIEEGGWKIVNNQLIIYDTDGVTPLYTFNLLDRDGNPAQRNVTERVPV